MTDSSVVDVAARYCCVTFFSNSQRFEKFCLYMPVKSYLRPPSPNISSENPTNVLLYRAFFQICGEAVQLYTYEANEVDSFS